MANVLFTRDSLTNIEDLSLHPVADGQLLFDTSGSGKMYMDVGTQRLEMGGAMTIDSKLNSTSTNPIQNKAVGGVMLSTLDEINATTSKGFITDALVTRELAQKIGTTDISSIGDGTCTGAISALNTKMRILWEGSINTAQTITLNSMDYDLLEVTYRLYVNYTDTVGKVRKGETGYISGTINPGGALTAQTYTLMQDFSVSEDGATVTFGQPVAWVSNTYGPSATDRIYITRIIGYKL